MRVRVVCAICEQPAIVETKPTLSLDPQRVATWRPFLFKSDDQIVESS